jgi:hypothetical protein
MPDDSDKTEEPTEHKLQEARKKGNVCKSMDMIQTMLLVATAGLLYAIRGHFVNQIVKIAHWSWGLYSGDINLAERNLVLDGSAGCNYIFLHTGSTFCNGCHCCSNCKPGTDKNTAYV